MSSTLLVLLTEADASCSSRIDRTCLYPKHNSVANLFISVPVLARRRYFPSDGFFAVTVLLIGYR